MPISINKKKTPSKDSGLVFIISKVSQLSALPLESDERSLIKRKLIDSDSYSINRLGLGVWIVLAKSEKEGHLTLEKLRKKGASICAEINADKRKEIHICAENGLHIQAMIEGLVLANYQFHKYRKDQKEKANSLRQISVDGPLSTKDLKILKGVLLSVYETKDLVNEPLSFLTAPQLGKEIKKIGKDAGFKVEVLGKKKIESLKMGGLLAVNKGSLDDPTFSIMEWRPKKANNKKPIVLVGKGVVYDTGGLSLKPTANSMDLMKSDMAGAAMMIGVMAAISRAELPVHVVALIPATDNRPGGNAYVPGDIVTMFDGTTVEVWNTDAEGRMLLADALSYAKKFDPELVIDSATLTGAAIRAIGTYASCIMGTASDKDFNLLEQSGFQTFERVVRMPFWEEYRKELDSDIADLKNLGGSSAGQISAGKFLEHFTDYPWIHIDIAGPSFLTSLDSYRGKWATGYGVRLLFDMLSNR